MSLENFRAINLKIDRANGSFLSDQFAKTGDYNGRRLVVQLSDAGVVGNLTGVDVNLGWQHDTLKNTGLDPFDPVDLAQGIFEIYYPKEMLNNGNVTALIQIIENDHITETKNFKIKVEKSVIDEDTIVSENSFTVLQDALLTVNRYDSRITNVENSKVDKSTFEQNKLSVEQQLQQTEQELSSQLADKVGGGKLATMDDLSQDVKTALAGGSVAVVGTNATQFPNLHSTLKKVSGKKTTLVNSGINNRDMYLNYADGAVVADAGHVLAQLSAVEGDVFYFTGYLTNALTGLYFFLDTNFEVLSKGVQGTGTRTLYNEIEAIAPAGTAYVRFVCEKLNSSYTSSYVLKKVEIETTSVDDKITTAETVTYEAEYTGDFVETQGFYPRNSNVFTVSEWYRTVKINCKKGDTFKIVGVSQGNANVYDYYRAMANDHIGLVKWSNAAGTNNLNLTITAPENTQYITFTFSVSGDYKIYKLNNSIKDYVDTKTNAYVDTKPNAYWKNKKIVWFGTSIPAGTYLRASDGKYISYPDRVGELLGATVVNESVGSSAVARQNPDWINVDNPYGFSNNFIESAKGLTNTIAAQQWLIDHWQDAKWTSGKYTTMTLEQQVEIMSWSYENKLVANHLGENRPDLFIFDHGRNDQPDVAPYNYQANIALYGTKNPYSYIAGMNLLLDLIYTDNPKARVVQISHYESKQTPTIIDKQVVMTELWSIDFYRLDKKLGWTQNTITTTGYWQSGVWIPSGGTPQTLTLLNANLADGVHPHSDVSGDAINKIAQILACYLDNEVR